MLKYISVDQRATIEQMFRDGARVRDVVRVTGLCRQTVALYRPPDARTPREVAQDLFRNGLTVGQVARKLGCHRNTAARWQPVTMTVARHQEAIRRRKAVPPEIAALRNAAVAAFMAGDDFEFGRLNLALRAALDLKEYRAHELARAA